MLVIFLLASIAGFSNELGFIQVIAAITRQRVLQDVERYCSFGPSFGEKGPEVMDVVSFIII